MLTGHDDEEYMEAGFRAGIDDFVLKPFRRDQLVGRIRRMRERSDGSTESTVDVPTD